MEPKLVFHPSVGMVVAKATAFANVIEMNSSQLPPLEWILELETVGAECPNMLDENGNPRKGNIVLEYADKFKQIITHGSLTWKKQSEHYRNNKLKLDKGSKIMIVEYMFIPYYNIMGVVERDQIIPQYTTVYDLTKSFNSNSIDLNIN